MYRQRQSGFTLVEISVAVGLMLLGIAAAMLGLRYAIRGTSQNTVQDELDVDVQVSMETVKRDLRMTSLDNIFYYPAGYGPYTAISFPVAEDSDGDGALEFDPDLHVIWDKTVIYHVWVTVPSQLRKTVFSPRNPNLTHAQRQEQLNRVVLDGHGSNTYDGASAKTSVVFENLFTWQITPKAGTVDAYATQVRREDRPLGTCQLAPGVHSFEFRVLSLNSNLMGHIGLDTLTVSPSYSPREAEAQLPVLQQLGASAASVYMAGGSWSGNHQLLFRSSTVNDYFTLSLANDRWEETNFNASGADLDNTRVVFDTTQTPSNFVLQLSGMATNWWATEQTGDPNGSSCPFDSLQGYAVRVPIRGKNMVAGGWLSSDGRRCRIRFRSGVGPLGVEAVYLTESASSESNGVNAVAAAPVQMRFRGLASTNIPSQKTAWTDYATYPIGRDKTYFVTYLVKNNPSHGTPWRWVQTTFTNAPGCYVIPLSYAPTLASIQASAWSALPGVRSTNLLFGVEQMLASYPASGSFVSQVFDTSVSAPTYTDIGWNADVPSDAALAIKVRTGNNAALSDAPAWTNASVVARTTPGTISPGAGRYVQFKADLTSNAEGTTTPRLKDVTIKWTGPERIVEVAAVVTKGPNYGVFGLKVDGKPLVSGLDIELQIFKDARGFRGEAKRMTSSLKSEVNPRNTGR